MIQSKAIQRSGKVISKSAMRGLLFLASLIGMNIGNPFEAAKRMLSGDFEELKGKDVSVFVIGRVEPIDGKIEKVKKGYVILSTKDSTFCINADRIDYIES